MMMSSKNLGAVLRRDAAFIGNAVGVVVFVGFASLAVGATIIDLMAIGN